MTLLTISLIFGAATTFLAALYFMAKEKEFHPIDEAYQSFRSLAIVRRVMVALILVGFTYVGSTKGTGPGPTDPPPTDPPEPPPAQEELAEGYGPFEAGCMIKEVDLSFLEGYKVAGLPTGLKYDSKKSLITGVPTKPGVYEVKLTKKVGKDIDTKTTTFYIANYQAANEYIKGGLDNGVDEDKLHNKEITIYQGVSDVSELPNLVLDLEQLSPKAKIAVSGLPAGLKFAAKDVLNKDKTIAVEQGSVYGTPTKVGAFTTMITVSDSATKLKAVSSITIKVEALPAWALGTFNGGYFENAEENSICGLVTLTTTQAGKISGKILKNGQTWTVSAASFDSFDEEEYHATLTAKSGKLSPETYKIVISEEGVSGSNEAGEGIVAYQNLWKTGWRNLGKELAAKYKKTGLPSDDSELMLKFAASGAVTASKSYVTGTGKKGKDIIYKATCSTVLIPIFNEQGEIESGLIYLYFAPNSKKSFEGESRVVKIGEKSED